MATTKGSSADFKSKNAANNETLVIILSAPPPKKKRVNHRGLLADVLGLSKSVIVENEPNVNPASRPVSPDIGRVVGQGPGH